MHPLDVVGILPPFGRQNDNKGGGKQDKSRKNAFFEKNLLEKFAGLEKSRTFASLLKQETSGV